MSVMFHDIHEEAEGKIGNHTMDYFNWSELIYADDIMLAGHRAREINIFLSAKYNLKLNYGKCICVARNGKAHTHFSDGKPMKQVIKQHI